MPWYSAPPDGTWVQQMYGALRGRTVGQADTAWLGSGNLVARRTAFQAIQGFDATLDACEDVDLCQRLRAEGWRVVGDERLGSVHQGDPPTLGRLFRAERWRGRDNLKVSFHGPLSLRGLPSALIPVVDLAAFAVALWGLITWPTAGRASLLTALAAGAVVLALASLRVLRGVVSGRVGVTRVIQATIVSVVWDIARALALVWPAPHHRPAADDNATSGIATT